MAKQTIELFMRFHDTPFNSPKNPRNDTPLIPIPVVLFTLANDVSVHSRCANHEANIHRRKYPSQ